MIKLIYCLRRHPRLSWQEFSDYWCDIHAPLVAARAEVLGIRRYVQVRTVQVPRLHDALSVRNGGSPQPYDGVAELWYESLEAFASSDASRAQAAAELLADELNFIDVERSPLWLANEFEVINIDAPPCLSG